MKKFLLVMILVISTLWCTSVSFAAEANENTNYINEELFKYILFDYNFLTGNSEKESQEIFDELQFEFEEQDITFLQSIGIVQESSEEIILFLQENYDELIENNDSENKELIDKYLLTHSLKYYYNVFGDDFKYQDAIASPTNEIAENQMRSGSTKVVSIRVCSDARPRLGSIASTGMEAIMGHHSWIQVCNLTSSEITVGGLTVSGFDTITIGTWHGSVHDGVFYNLEIFCREQFSTTESVYAVKTLTQAELNVLNAQITLPSNDTWSLTNNCSSFAARMWNSVADYQVSAGIIPTPVNLADSILEDAGGMTELLLPTDAPVYYRAVDPIRYRLSIVV